MSYTRSAILLPVGVCSVIIDFYSRHLHTWKKGHSENRALENEKEGNTGSFLTKLSGKLGNVHYREQWEWFEEDTVDGHKVSAAGKSLILSASRLIIRNRSQTAPQSIVDRPHKSWRAWIIKSWFLFNWILLKLHCIFCSTGLQDGGPKAYFHKDF